MTIDVDYVEVGREAHQLASTYGWDAWLYASRWEKMATNEGKLEEAAFWHAVVAALKPR
jgi:hypothetical protein